MENEGTWWTAPTESAENGSLVMVTGRRDVEKFRDNPKFRYRVEVIWNYGASGMPDEQTSEIMEKVNDALAATFKKDPVAVMTGIYTGDGRRDWVFYTLSLHIFQRKLNEALAQFPPLPLEFTADDDPEWEEYAEMKSASEIAEDDD